MTIRDWVVISATAFFALFVVIASWTLIKLVGLLEEATRSVREATDRILPTLEQLTDTAAGVNVELARVDTILAGVQSITTTGEKLVSLVHAAVANPLVKVAGFAAGAGRAAKRFRDQG